MCSIAILTVLLTGAAFGNPVIKRGIFYNGYNLGVQAVPAFDFGRTFTVAVPVQKYHPAPSVAEIAAAVAAAKEASANVFAAQHRVNAAKEEVLIQQKLANHKEAQAALALQHTEAAAAVQRQQASAAANAVVLAQQRLAQTKSDVAEQQRIASEKEAAAAAAIHHSANAAAAEIRKTETTAAKVAAIQSSEAAAVLKHVTSTKDASLAATSAAVAGNIGIGIRGPWIFPGNFSHFNPWN